MILVTGATGKVGRELVKRLQASRIPFRVGVRSPEKAAGLDAAHFDLDRPETFPPALQGVDRLFLLSSGGTEREIPVVDAAKKAGVQRVVKLSVWGAEKEAFAFARLHRAVERDLETSGLTWTFLRPNGFMQNFLGFADSIRKQGAFYQPEPDFPHSCIDGRDIAAVAVKALTEDGHAGKAYTLSGPEALTNADIAEKISRAIGKKVSVVFVTEEQYQQGLLSAGLPAPYAEAILDLIRYYRAGGGEEITPWVERLTGQKPISFDQFARDHAAAWT